MSRVGVKVGELLARVARRLGGESEVERAALTGAQQQARLEEAQRIAGIGSWEWDIPADRATWSDEFFRLYGYEPGSFEPNLEAYMATVHPEDRERVQAIVERAMADHQPFSYEVRVVRPDGSERVCH
ncbi:MAG TPA: PAS domain-containing protein, partial [Gemmatimonadota bacterium]|nr:PAS domain-containing protein [Gemmatimonadota bacterium]